jgi:hypothetical protein
MVESAQNRRRDHSNMFGEAMAARHELVPLGRRIRNTRSQAGMRTTPIIVGHPFAKNPSEMSELSPLTFCTFTREVSTLSFATGAHHQIVRTGYPVIGSSFVMKSRPSATACAIRMRSNGSLCSVGSVANALT